MMEKNATLNRRWRQRGIEAIEFGLFMIVWLPPLIWMFINGMNFIRFIKATDIARSTSLMFIKGQDFTMVGTQNIISRVASGMNLQVGTAGGASGYTSGDGLIIVSKVQYIGTTSCSSCNNIGYYVFTSRVKIGNKNLQVNGTQVYSSLGDPASGIWSTSTGMVSSFTTNSGARVTGPLSSWFTSTISDSQYVYVVECFFAPPGGFGSGGFQGNGVYTRVLM